MVLAFTSIKHPIAICQGFLHSLLIADGVLIVFRNGIGDGDLVEVNALFLYSCRDLARALVDYDAHTMKTLCGRRIFFCPPDRMSSLSSAASVWW